jgi:HSP90 family molecular chaperone
MQKDQKAIYYITAETYESAKGSPHLEIFNQKDIEVLLLSDLKNGLSVRYILTERFHNALHIATHLIFIGNQTRRGLAKT